jgi:hypothetical protein
LLSFALLSTLVFALGFLEFVVVSFGFVGIVVFAFELVFVVVGGGLGRLIRPTVSIVSICFGIFKGNEERKRETNNWKLIRYSTYCLQ